VVEKILDRALKLDSENGVTLQENLGIRLSHPELQGNIFPLIARLSETNPEAAELILLAIDASGEDGEFSPNQSHLTRAREIIAADSTRLQSWLLATRLYRAFFQRGDVLLDDTAVEVMLQEYERLLEDARSFFPNDSRFSSSLVWVRRVQGNFVSARDAAAAQYRRSPKGENWNSLIQLCISESQLGNFGQVCELLIPLKLRIEERFDVRAPLCVCFTRALVESGQFALALDFLTNCKREAVESVPIINLLAFTVNLDAERAKELIEFFLSKSGDLENANLLAATSLSEVFSLSSDPEARQMGLDLLGEIPLPPTRSLARIQFEGIRLSLAGELGSYESLLASREMLDQFQPELWESVSQGEGKNSQGEQEMLISFLSPLVIAGNNFVALVGEVGSKGLIPASEKAAFCERAMRVEQSLRSIASELGDFQDSCAMYYRYCGDLDLALQFSSRAVEIAPMKPEFYLTLADTHVDREEFELATVAAETAFRLLEKAPQKNEKAMKRATEIRELSRGTSSGEARK
jgi:tetratricopeptide (TPR) repeat protein